MDKSTLKVVVVNGSQMLRTIIRDSLKKTGFGPMKSSENGETGLRLAAADPPHLIIADYSLADMTGLELLEKVRQNPRLAETAFILISSEPEQCRVALAAEHRVSAYIVKPFSNQTLIEKVNRVLERTLTPSHGLTAYRSANRLVREGKVDEALAQYRQALGATQYAMAAVYYRIGQVLETCNRTDEAETNYLSAVRRSNRYVEAFDALGDLADRRGSHHAAVEYLGQSTKISPLNAARQLKYGESLLAAGDYSGAEKAYRASLDLDPMQKTYLLNRMGIAMWRQKRLREAKDCFLQALDTAREEKETIHYNLAQCLIDLDDRSSARHHLEKALEHKEDFPEARVLLSKLGPA